jgi:hypothetical protein
MRFAMIRPLLFSALAAAVMLTAASGQDKPAAKLDEPVVAELRKAKAEFQTAFDKAKENLLAKFADEEKRLTDTTTLKIDEKVKRLKQLDTEKKVFTEVGKLPKAAALKMAVHDYQVKFGAAKKKCELAFDAVAAKYGKKDLAVAQAVLAEKETFFRSFTDTREFWVGKNCTFTQGANGEWTERGNNGVLFNFKEIDRTKEYVEIKDAGRGLTIRLSDTKSVIKGEGGPWHAHNDGGWEPAKKK